MPPTHYVYLNLLDEVKAKLCQVQESLYHQALELQFDSIDIADTHLTLGVFALDSGLRRQSRPSLFSMAETILAQVMRIEPKFDIELRGLSHFSGKVIHIEVEKSSDLVNLRSNLLAALKVRGILQWDSIPYIPHITLFKSAPGVLADKEEVRKLLANVSVPSFDRVPVDQLYFEEV